MDMVIYTVDKILIEAVAVSPLYICATGHGSEGGAEAAYQGLQLPVQAGRR